MGIREISIFNFIVEIKKFLILSFATFISSFMVGIIYVLPDKIDKEKQEKEVRHDTTI